jgi:mono/diheme cytochrome c family protein
VVLGLLTNSSTNSSIVLVSPGYQGIGCQLYVAPAPDNMEAAKLIAQQLPNLPCTTISTTAAGAALLQQYCGWQQKHCMNLMVFQPETNAVVQTAMTHVTATPTATAGTVLPTAAAAPDTGLGDPPLTTTAAAVGLLAHSSSSSSISAVTSCAALQLRSCSTDNAADMQLVMQWAGDFLVQVFHLPSAPAAPQLQEMVLPRLQRGLYHVLYDSAPATLAAAAAATQAASAPVCMACHVPTSSDSARITMLYTPPEQRGRGYGRQTSELPRDVHLKYPDKRS